MGSTAYWFFIYYLLLLLFIFYKFINAVHFTNKGPSPCKSSKMKINFNKVVLKSLHMIIMGSCICLNYGLYYFFNWRPIGMGYTMGGNLLSLS